MKLGILISSVIVIVLIAVIIVASMGFADAPTIATRAKGALSKATLPGDLPSVADKKGSADVEPLYDQFLAMYEEHPTKFHAESPPAPSVADEAAGLLIRAMEEGDVREPFLDKHLPMRVNAKASFGDALMVMSQSLVQYAQEMRDKGQGDRAIHLNRAVFTLGQRSFEKCTRIENRFQGLFIMMLAGTDLYNWSGKDEWLAPIIDPWEPALNDVLHKWEEKAKTIQVLKPQVGDLLNVAEHDQDLTWRIEAVLRLGVRKRNPETRGNRRAILNAIEKYRQSSNPQIAAAAQASHELQSLDEVY